MSGASDSLDQRAESTLVSIAVLMIPQFLRRAGSAPRHLPHAPRKRRAVHPHILQMDFQAHAPGGWLFDHFPRQIPRDLPVSARAEGLLSTRTTQTTFGSRPPGARKRRMSLADRPFSVTKAMAGSRMPKVSRASIAWCPCWQPIPPIRAAGSRCPITASS